MNKEVTMTIRVEPDLRASFSQAAEREHRPAAQVIRDLMRTYVEEQDRARPARPTISPAERRRREEAINYGKASVALEGFSMPEAYQEHAQRYVNGEIEFKDLTAIVQDMAKDR